MIRPPNSWTAHTIIQLIKNQQEEESILNMSQRKL